MTDSIPAVWPCPTHGEASPKPCLRCGSFGCGICGFGTLCSKCGERRPDPPRVENAAAVVTRRAVVLALQGAAFFYATPGLIAALVGRRSGADVSGMVIYSLLHGGPSLVAGLLVLSLRRVWPVWLALPNTLFAIFIAAQLPSSGYTQSHFAAAGFVGLAWVLAIRAWRQARERPSLGSVPG